MARREARVGGQAREAVAHVVGARPVEEEPVVAVAHQRVVAGYAARDDRHSAGHRLQYHVGQALAARRVHQAVGTAVGGERLLA
jgi:hypothetical protein